jgi:hypothetical protein
VHTCRKWRRIVFASQGALHLWLFCTHRTLVQKSLDCWPVLPIIVQYGGSLELDPPVPEDEDDIMAALEQSDRVISISLTITTSLLEELSTIDRAFPELLDLVLLSRYGVQLTLPSTFRWGPCLRRLHLTGIAFPTLISLLYSSTNLIDLQLHDAFLFWQFSPVMLKNVLSEMTQLRSLSLHFRFTASYHVPLPQYGERVVLPVLAQLNFRGCTAYLEGIVALIDAPSLEDIEITFLDNPILTISKINNFIDRITMHRSHRLAHISFSEHAISISLTQPGAPTRLKMQLLGKPLHMQIFSMARICSHFSTVLFSVGELCISEMRHLGLEDSFDSQQWSELLNLFTGVKEFHVHGDDSYLHNLQLLERLRENMLPALHKLCIHQPGPRHVPLREAVVTFMVSRRLSGHPIEVEYERQRDTNEQSDTGTKLQCMRRASTTIR